MTTPSAETPSPPARPRFAAPSTISPAARAFLDRGVQSVVADRYPAPDDVAGWEAYVATSNDYLHALNAAAPVGAGIAVRTEVLGGVTTYVGGPDSDDVARGVVLFLHGGGLVLGGGRVLEPVTAIEIVRARRRIVSVDYRMPPRHPFPAALDDCIAAYRALTAQVAPSQIVVCGRSAGGNLAVAMVQHLLANGGPVPAGLVLLTPEVDLTESGDSFQVLRDVDVVIPRGLPDFNRLYAGDRDLADPAVSPLFGGFAGFPATMIQSGTRDIFLSNAVRLHRALRRECVAADLHVWEAMPHGSFGGFTPEDDEVFVEYRAFLDRCL